MQIAPILDRATVVLVGHFNPAIFSPAWLALNQIVGQEDAVQAVVQIVHPEIAQFEVGQFNIQCDTQRFIVSCATSFQEMARDLVMNTFGSLLRHTPVTGVGINREVHFDCGSYKVRNAVGNTIAPKSAWGSWSNKLTEQNSDPRISNGLVGLSMREMRPDGRYPGHVQADIQPSGLPQLSQQGGIYMSVNNHYQITTKPSEISADHLVTVISTEWGVASEKAELIIDQIQTLVLTTKAELEQT